MTRQILRMLESVDLEKSTCNCGNSECNICNPKQCNCGNPECNICNPKQCNVNEE